MWRSLAGTAALLLLPALSPITAEATTTSLVARGSIWKYLDNGSDQGTAWRSCAFSDASWASGPAELGYGDGDEETVVSYGPSSTNKYITTYFRQTFSAAGVSGFTGLTLRLKRDDGAIVYLNGSEVFRSNMPSGTVTYTTLASSSHDDGSYYERSLSPSLLVEGNNCLAVEVHQGGAGSSDLSFDLELIASDQVTVTRGPYLQRGSSTEVVVRWRTDVATSSLVRYGLQPAGQSQQVVNPAPVTEHQVALSGLQPNTRYYYGIGTGATVLAGGDSSHYFVTPPLPGSGKPTRIWVLGDSGTANANARAVRDGYIAFGGSRHTDLWLMLGDNAYNTGLDTEFQAAVFNMYPTFLRTSVLWPTLGNHDAGNAFSATQTGPYYDIFTLPKNAEAGGLPSGTEAYYSFDYGRIHFVCLDSQDSNRATSGPMLTWLAADLASTAQDWIIAYWHHPPYSKGSHDSDNAADSSGRMRDMRQNALPILEQYGVDLVLTGHSHSYERSFLLSGHYDVSGTLTPAMKLNAGDGRTDGDGAYQKDSLTSGSADGAVYVVAGSSGMTSGGTLNHPAMYLSLNSLGSLVLDIDRNQLEAKFLGTTGAVLDRFTMVKDAETTPGVESIRRLDADPTTATLVRFAVQFNQSVTGVGAEDFAVVGAGLTNPAVQSISGTGSEYVVEVSYTSGSGSLRLDLVDDNSIRNGISAPLGGSLAGDGNWTGEAYSISPAIPVVVSRLHAE